MFRTVSFGATNTGLATVGYKIRAAGGSLGVRITAGVSELVAGSGIYTADVDESSSPVGIVWDTGEGGSTVYAAEDFVAAVVSLGATAPANWINAAALTPDASAEISAKVWVDMPAGTPLADFAAAIWEYATRTLTSGGSGGATAAEVWAHATRTLSAGTNIVLAKGTGVTGFNDISAAQVNTEADAALADVGLTTTITGRIDAAVSSRAPSATALSNATWTGTKAGFLDAAISGVSTGGVSAGDIAIAVRDVPNAAPASNSLGAAVNVAAAGGGGGGGGASAAEVAAAILLTPANKLKTDDAGRVTGAADVLDAVSTTLMAEPVTFPQRMLWLFHRFVRARRVKATGIISVYGSNGTSVVTNQLTTDNATEQTTGAFQ